MGNEHETSEAKDGMNGHSGKIPLWRGLAMRQLLITLGFALLVGLATGAIELVSGWHDLRNRIDTTTKQNLELVRASAAEAAFQLNADQANNVVAGLLNFEETAHVVLRDNFGTVLAEGTRSGASRAFSVSIELTILSSRAAGSLMVLT